MHFAAALNFTSCKDDVVDILVNGQWSQRAASEAEKYARVNIVNDLTADQQTQFDAAEWNLSEVGGMLCLYNYSASGRCDFAWYTWFMLNAELCCPCLAECEISSHLQ